MGTAGWLWFYDEDEDLVKDIAKLHRIDDVELVKKHYKEMLKNLKNEVENKKEN